MKKKKSDLLNSLQESEASGSGLKIVREYKKEAPTLRSDRHGLLVSGLTKLTDTPAKSIEKGSVICHNLQPRRADRPSLLKNPGAGGSGHLTKAEESYCLESGNQQAVEFGMNQASSSRAIFGKFPPRIYPTMTFSAVASLVKVFPLREGVRVFKTSQGELFSLKSAESLEVKDQATYSLRMLKDYFLMTQAEPSQLYSFRWMNLGTMSSGRCATLNISFRKAGKGSLFSVLEDEVEEKYYLSDKMLEKITEKKDAHPDIKWKSGIRGEGRVKFPDDLNKPSRTITTAESGANRMTHGIQQVGNVDTKGHNSIWGRVYSPEGQGVTINAKAGGLGAKTGLYKTQSRIRRLTPVECERLQGFPDNWTKVKTVKNDAGIDDEAGEDYGDEKIYRLKGKVMSDAQRYKMMGNAVSVPVITTIGKKISSFIDGRKN